MGSTNKSYVGTEFCGLCRGRFPQEMPKGHDVWQSKFRAVLRLDSNDEHSIEITNVASLPGIHDDVDVSLPERPPPETVTICRSQQVNVERPTDGPAFCFHDWCYSILIWKLQRFSKSIIKLVTYKLVGSLLPSSSLWRNICEARHQLDPTSTLQTLVAHAERSPLDFQPFLMSRLPAEVRVRIWEYVGLSTPYSAFILVGAELSRLARYVKSRPTRDLALEQGCLLSAKMIMVFGTEYIQDLVIDKDHKGTSKVLGDVTGLKFVLSLSGICAIKVIGIDWETDWLGKVPGVGHVWHGMMRDIIPRLRFTYNGLNCVNISNLGLGTANLILWDKPNIPSSLVDPDAALFDFERDMMRSNGSIITNPARRYFRYLPLYNGAEYIKGLTLYHTANGIVGLEAHFEQTSQFSGCRNGCALYFPLCPNEQIAYAWLRILNFSSIVWAAPALMLQTTQGRHYSFGSYIRPDLVVRNQYKWILLESSGCVTGLYYENSLSTIMRIGVVGDGFPPTTTPLTPQYSLCPIPPIAGPNAGLFLSVAILSDLEKVDLCRVSNRCIGILIQYTDGLITVLGQWQTAGVAQHSCIYKSNDKSDTKSVPDIYFRMTRCRSYDIVTDVSFSEGYSKAITSDSSYQVFGAGKYIAWWFSEFYDAVLPWTGVTRDIPSESEIRQKQVV